MSAGTQLSQLTSTSQTWRARSSDTLELIAEVCTASTWHEQTWDVQEAPASDSATATTEVRLMVKNVGPEPIELLWLRSEDDEVWYTQVLPNGLHEQVTASAQRWRVRVSTAMDVVLSELCTDEASEQVWEVGEVPQTVSAVPQTVSSGGAESVSEGSVILEVINRRDEPVELLWVQPARRDQDGQCQGESEVWYQQVSPATEAEQQAKQGDIWRVRSATTLCLVAEMCASKSQLQQWPIQSGASSSGCM